MVPNYWASSIFIFFFSSSFTDVKCFLENSDEEIIIIYVYENGIATYAYL